MGNLVVLLQLRSCFRIVMCAMCLYLAVLGLVCCQWLRHFMVINFTALGLAKSMKLCLP